VYWRAARDFIVARPERRYEDFQRCVNDITAD
jgi:hypothetical protein